ncbi:carbon monoxide dehydrogenase subunit G [Mariniluteicoccus endophyticus]
MQITGTAHMNAPIPEAWAAFHDPGVLSRTIPGLQSLEQTGEDAYKASVSAGVASIKGTYVGNVALTEQVEHESFLLKASGQGGPGTISADVRVRLTEADDGGSDITWGADASVGGAIGGVGQRMLQGVARKMATQFFAAIDGDIATGGKGQAPSATGGKGQAPSAAAGETGEQASVQQRPTEQTSGEPAAAGQTGQVWSKPAAPAATGGSSPRDLALGAVLGATIALVGVAIGIAAGRR